MHRLLNQFNYDHLPLHLQEVSEPFYGLAQRLVNTPDLERGDLEISLRLLLQAKDAAVRARL